MESKKCYIVSISFGSYEDHWEKIDCVYLDKEEAVLRRGYLTDFYEEEIPFPFDWCTEQDFWDLMDSGQSTDEDIEIYTAWDSERDSRHDFGGVWIKESIIK